MLISALHFLTSGTGALATANLFLDIAIVKNDGTDTANDETVLLATSNGLWVTDESSDSATDQTDAGWAQVANQNASTDGLFYYRLFTPNTSSDPRSVLAFSSLNDAQNRLSLSNLQEICFPTVFNFGTLFSDIAIQSFVSDGSGSSSQQLLFAQTNYSDGGRRFFIDVPYDSNHLTNQLRVAPYNVGSTDSNITTQPAAQTAGVLAATDVIYWLNNVGAGFVMAGTNYGVMTLGGGGVVSEEEGEGIGFN